MDYYFRQLVNSKFLIINNFTKEYKISVGKKPACTLIAHPAKIYFS